MITISIENLISSGAKLVLDPFNFTEFYDEYDKYSYSKTNSSLFRISHTLGDINAGTKLLKFTNNPVKAWADIWTEQESSLPIDPLIESVDLSGCTLELASFIETRSKLKELNFSGCTELKYLNVSGCEALEYLNLSGCTTLEKINFGFIKKVKRLNLRSCSLTGDALHDILSAYYPTESSVSRYGFKPIYDSYVDLRGNYINWLDKGVASKIRLLLTNNILVLWDINPPDSIIPIQYYRSWQT
jgi:hypothetical protein